jgi:hypothetical protein
MRKALSVSKTAFLSTELPSYHICSSLSRSVGNHFFSSGSRKVSTSRASTSVIRAACHMPAPMDRPRPATNHIVAAVVRPFTLLPILMKAPAPRKPMPETTWAAIRPGSPLSPPTDCGSQIDRSIRSVAPRPMMIWVRQPAVCLRISLSRPTRPQAKRLKRSRASAEWKSMMGPPSQVAILSTMVLLAPSLA